jgi:hypothetical protein
MATQPLKNNEPGQGQPIDLATPDDATWRILAKEAAEEEDPEKLLQIVKTLSLALEEEEEAKTKST